MVACNGITPKKTYSTAPSIASTRTFRSCSSDFPTTAFLSDASKTKKVPSNSKDVKFRRRARLFSCGLVSNVLNVFTFIASLLLLLSSFIKLHDDSDVELLDISWLMPTFLYSIMFSRQSFLLPATCFLAHVLSMRVMKTRKTFPDLVAVVLWLILLSLKTKTLTQDVIVYQLGFSAILSIVAFSVTFFPRKLLHRRKPNSIIQSAFSVASTPVSQCSTATARSTPSRLLSSQKDLSFVCEDRDTFPDQHRQRNFSPSRELSSLFGGLNLGKRTPDDCDNLRRRGPFGSMKKPILAPSRFNSGSETVNSEIPYSSCYASSTVPSLMTSVSQTVSQHNFSLVNVVCISALSVSVSLNFAFLYYALYAKCK